MDLFKCHVSIVLVYKSIKQCSWRCFLHGHFLYHGDIKEKRSSQIKKKKRKEKKREEKEGIHRRGREFLETRTDRDRCLLGHLLLC